MATINFYSSVNMTRIGIRYGDVLIYDSSKILISNGYNGGIYYGIDFTYESNKITGGILTGYDAFTNFRTYNYSFDVEASVRDVNIPAIIAYNYIKNGDALGLLKYAISGDDVINGSVGDDYLIGEFGKDRLIGNSGNDIIDGGGDSDALFGGDGNDVLYGGNGNDVIDGGNGSDTYLFFSEQDRSSAEIRDSGIKYSGADGGDYDVVNFVSNVPGSTLKLYPGDKGIEEVRIVSGSNNFGIPDDIDLNIDASNLNYGLTIIGHYGSDSLFGGSGDDVLVGFKGNDFINGGSGFDYVAYNDEVNPVNVNLSISIYQKTGDSGSDKLINIEGLIGGSASDTLIGNFMDNILSGGGGNDKLLGMGGADRLLGEEGNDLLDAGKGADRMEGGAGNDIYIVDNVVDVVIEGAGSGADTVKASVSVSLWADVENLTLTGTANLSGRGNDLANKITGNGGANALLGGGGADALKGGAGSDTLYGGEGKDTLIGGAGQDFFLFDAAPGAANADRITDFSFGDNDKIQLSKAVFAGFNHLGALTADEFYSAAGAKAAHDASDRVIYDTTSGKLYYDADGLGGTAAVQFAVMGSSSHPVLIYSDIQIIA